MKLYNFHILAVGGRYKIYMEEREGFVDSSLIIGNIASQDHMTRYNSDSDPAHHQLTIRIPQVQVQWEKLSGS